MLHEVPFCTSPVIADGWRESPGDFSRISCPIGASSTIWDILLCICQNLSTPESRPFSFARGHGMLASRIHDPRRGSDSGRGQGVAVFRVLVSKHQNR